MVDIPSVAKRIQEAETQFEAPVSESTARKMGGTMNFLLDHYAIPPGSEMFFNGLEGAVPPGWQIADGRAISRTTYANLFAAIGTLWGTGNGVTTFNVPDKRGTFNRMVDATSIGARGLDVDAYLRVPQGTGTAQDPGSYQADQFRQHAHVVRSNNGASGGGWLRIGDAGDLTKNTDASGGSDTRPYNYNGFCIIKE